MRRLFLLAAVAGCYTPSYQDCAISCAVSGVCPSGLNCVAGVCRTMTGACGGETDASIGTWQFRKPVTIGRVVQPGDAGPSSFPVLIRIESDPDLANFAQSSGADIKFTTLDGAKLHHEIERFADGIGELVAWVQVPVLSDVDATRLYMYYGNPETPDQQAPDRVWDDGYVGVWHLSDPPGTTLRDSTARAMHGTKSATNAPAPVAFGAIAGAHAFAGTMDHFSIGNDAANLDHEERTFELWIDRTQSSVTSLHRVLEFPAAFVHHRGLAYASETAPTGLVPSALIVTGPSGVDVQSTPINSLPADRWHHVVVVLDAGAGTKVYIDGEAQTLTSIVFPLVQDNTTVTIGGSQGTDRLSVHGQLDEVRVSRTARSEVHAAVSYENQRPGSTLVTVGTAETVP